MDWTVIAAGMPAGLVAIMVVVCIAWLYRIDHAVTILQVQLRNVIEALQERDSDRRRHRLSNIPVGD